MTILEKALVRRANKHGYDIRHDLLGFYLCTLDEADFEDGGRSSVGFDGRAHWPTIKEAARHLPQTIKAPPNPDGALRVASPVDPQSDGSTR